VDDFYSVSDGMSGNEDFSKSGDKPCGTLAGVSYSTLLVSHSLELQSPPTLLSRTLRGLAV
jgi:hypothetical protein